MSALHAVIFPCMKKNALKFSLKSFNFLDWIHMLSLFLKCVIGAAVVLLIALLSKSKAFYIAGLVPLFPTFALIAHVIVAQDKGGEALKQTALFGMWSLIPYFVYLLVVYILATKMPVWSCLGIATACWIIAAVVLTVGWNSYFSA